MFFKDVGPQKVKDVGSWWELTWRAEGVLSFILVKLEEFSFIPLRPGIKIFQLLSGELIDGRSDCIIVINIALVGDILFDCL